MASLTDIIQQRVIQKKYEALPEWLRWILFLPLTLIITFIAYTLCNTITMFLAIGLSSSMPIVAMIILVVLTPLLVTYLTVQCFFTTSFFTAPKYKNEILFLGLVLIFTFFIYITATAIDGSIKTVNQDSHSFSKDPDYGILLTSLLPGILLSVLCISITVRLYKKALSPRKRLVDIGTNLNRKEDLGGGLLG